MSITLSFYHDRTPLTELPTTLSNILLKNGLSGYQGIKSHFCGLIINEQVANIFLPRGSVLPKSKKEGVKLAALLMKAIKLYTAEHTNHLPLTDEGDDLIGTTQLTLIIKLLDDFLNNGLYTQRQSERLLNAGQSDWKKTIAKSPLFVGTNGAVYLDIYGVRKRYVANNEISRIHASIIRQIDSEFSWIITGTEHSIASSLNDVPLPIGNQCALMLANIQKELSSTFSSREIHLLTLMAKYLKKEYGQYSNKTIIGTRNFHVFWEHMLHKTLQWTFPINQHLASPAYLFEGKQLKIAASKGQRLDTILKQPNMDNYAIIDAKYYDASSLNSAPGWPDLVKQFFYAKALSIYSPNATIRNNFVFPGQKKHISSAHMYDKKNTNLLDLEYPPIYCHYIDPELLLKHYVNRQKLEEKSKELLGLI